MIQISCEDFLSITNQLKSIDGASVYASLNHFKAYKVCQNLYLEFWIVKEGHAPSRYYACWRGPLSGNLISAPMSDFCALSTSQVLDFDIPKDLKNFILFNLNIFE